ncbi:DotU family type IV/VI secretion system protein [Stutzerimonas kirkiae]|uniref:DotU family type IV/VI secretion system protein n=1 Tax=Stutzerimonas kirkiae TaxID=2211392 RepID=UPI001038491C|nr:DotU/TssL family secretion system protein [Stutzerimonas kirkiae]TBV10810.1 type VI secretion system protein ImpK [Stutzerimonas kirkiae]
MNEGKHAIYPPAFGESVLSQAFQQAWLDWQRCRVRHQGGEAVPIERVVDDARAIVRRLWRTAMVEVGESASDQVKGLVYAFVALLDETLLFEDWTGQAAWQERPLELRLYGTRNAGERLPGAIQHLLKARSPSNRDLANVYLLCLLLGFRGCLRGPRGEALHEKWRQALYAHAWQRDADGEGLLARLQQPSQVALQRLPLSRSLPDGTRLGLALLLALGLLLVIAHGFWRDIRDELEPALHLLSPMSQETRP